MSNGEPEMVVENQAENNHTKDQRRHKQQDEDYDQMPDEPKRGGQKMNVPGKLVDILSDPSVQEFLLIVSG